MDASLAQLDPELGSLVVIEPETSIANIMSRGAVAGAQTRPDIVTGTCLKLLSTNGCEPPSAISAPVEDAFGA